MWNPGFLRIIRPPSYFHFGPGIFFEIHDLGFLPRADEIPASRPLVHFSKKALGGVPSFTLAVETRNRFSFIGEIPV